MPGTQDGTTQPPAAGSTGIDIAAIISLISGISGGDTSNANKVADAADPYRSQRAQWQQPIIDLMNNPSSILEDPTFKSSLNLGLESVSRQAGAAGMGLSGNRMAELEKYGQTAASGAIQQKFKNLEDLAGVTSGSPAAAAGAIAAGQKNTANSIGAGLGGLDAILGQIFGTGTASAGIIGAFKQLLGGADPSSIDPAALAEINKIIGGGGGLGTFNDAGVTPGGTAGLFGDTPGGTPGVPSLTDIEGGVTGGYVPDPSMVDVAPPDFYSGGGSFDNLDLNGFDFDSIFGP